MCLCCRIASYTMQLVLRFRNYDEMACSNIILHQHVRNCPRTLFSFFYPWLSNLPLFFPLFCVGRNEHKFLVFWEQKCSHAIFWFNISGASWVNTETWLFDKHRNFIFSGLSFRPTFYLAVQIMCNNFWFIRVFDLSKCYE